MTSRSGRFKPDLYVVSRIVKCLVDYGPLKKTNLATSAGLSYDNMVEYLQWMVGRGLIGENDGRVEITDKGVKAYNDLVSWIVEYVGQLKFGRQL